jgi:hypothetical protein
MALAGWAIRVSKAAKLATWATWAAWVKKQGFRWRPGWRPGLAVWEPNERGLMQQGCNRKM